jgi:molybdopterin/thiamine biosynthesis adenylyltransferase
VTSLAQEKAQENHSHKPAVHTNDDRYSRQILFRGMGAEGQARLARSRVAIVGCGATGSALAALLARAGVGTLRIIDRDYVEPSNLQRQSLFDEQDASESLPKAIAAARKIAAFNSQIAVEPKVDDVVPANIEALLEGMEIILDGTDNFEARYLINDFAVKNSLPWIYSAAVGSYAATMSVLPGETACLACIFPNSPRGIVDTCETSGILNSAVNLVASIAATETLKLLVADGTDGDGADGPDGTKAQQLPTHLPKTLRKTLLSFDLWTNEHAEITAAKPRPGCRACGQRDFIHLAGEGRPHITLCGRNSVQIHERQRPIDFTEMNRRLQPHGTVRHNDFVLKFWHDPYEMTLFPDGRAIIKGTTDTAVARSLYARYVGS